VQCDTFSAQLYMSQVRQDDESTSLSLSAIPRTTCHPHKSHVLVGGLGGFGLELAHWLVERGARYLVLTSRGGVRTGYQDRRVRELRKAGVMVTVSTRDVNDAEEARALIREAASMCRDGVASVFNLAVVPFDGSVLVQTAEEWLAAAKPKVSWKPVINLNHTWYLFLFSLVSVELSHVFRPNRRFGMSIPTLKSTSKINEEEHSQIAPVFAPNRFNDCVSTVSQNLAGV